MSFHRPHQACYRSCICLLVLAAYLSSIGWAETQPINDKHPFPVGDMPPEFLTRLKDFCRRWGDGLESLAWPVFLGPHSCELCRKCMASGNIGVPAGDILFAAPEMVAHYVEAHRYAPPAEFVKAVLECPPTRSQEYLKAVQGNAPKGFVVGR